ncbi:hypothetical protein MRX96_031559 [Rhipicephalus microplus]
MSVTGTASAHAIGRLLERAGQPVPHETCGRRAAADDSGQGLPSSLPSLAASADAAFFLFFFYFTPSQPRRLVGR